MAQVSDELVSEMQAFIISFLAAATDVLRYRTPVTSLALSWKQSYFGAFARFCFFIGIFGCCRRKVQALCALIQKSQRQIQAKCHVRMTKKWSNEAICICLTGRTACLSVGDISVGTDKNTWPRTKRQKIKSVICDRLAFHQKIAIMTAHHSRPQQHFCVRTKEEKKKAEWNEHVFAGNGCVSIQHGACANCTRNMADWMISLIRLCFRQLRWIQISVRCRTTSQWHRESFADNCRN